MEDFTYRGYPVKKLIELCSFDNVYRGKAPVIFILPEQYSQGRIFREYARFPEELPLNIYGSHGVGIDDKVYPHEINNNAYAFFAFNDMKYKRYKENAAKPCYKVPAPMIWYRREHGIEQVKNPKGTLFFAMHSTPDIEALYSIEEICARLKSLPDEMQPVSVCLFMTDIHKNVFLKYLEQGIPVYTAGSVWDIRFVDRYYSVLRQFKYTASNYIGSYMYYSIEMGIPFSFLRQENVLYNNKDINMPKGIMPKSSQTQKIENLFLGINTTITSQQRNFVDYVVSMKNYISREEMYKVLQEALVASKHK